jgi:hypothetical protein
MKKILALVMVSVFGVLANFGNANEAQALEAKFIQVNYPGDFTKIYKQIEDLGGIKDSYYNRDNNLITLLLMDEETEARILQTIEENGFVIRKGGKVEIEKPISMNYTNEINSMIESELFM